ncbi:MAG: RluA family pseudouridine synthase [Bacteroidia bacterium]|nr:RluA family pseudouridine synthase [Bacteroidia bacterium]NNJ56650.1 RluA family pseudouridine synthase [Bacteroidia bacterium]
MSSSEENLKEELFLRYSFIADEGQEPLRIDKFLVNRIEKATRNKLREAIDANQVKVNGKSIKASYKVKPGDSIDVMVDKEPNELLIIPQDIPINIVFEDDDLMIINKEPGMVVHPGFGNSDGTLLNALAFHFGVEVDSKGKRPWLVHRIDKDTSGLLVIAKNDEAMTHLSKQFQDHTIERTYNALVWGSVEQPEGTISTFIGRDIYNRKKFVTYMDEEKGKWAVTHYKVLEDFTYTSLVQCNLETGRTHQIRVHMKHMGHPLFNDEFYGGNRILKGVVFSKYKHFVENCFSIMPRQGLHAKSLGFEHPTTGKWMQFDSDLPHDMAKVIDKWRNVKSTYSF